jgi:hypothetical protein
LGLALAGEPMHQFGPPITLHFDAPFSSAAARVLAVSYASSGECGGIAVDLELPETLLRTEMFLVVACKVPCAE